MQSYKIDDLYLEAPEGFLKQIHLFALANGSYEAFEQALADLLIRPGARVLEFGGGAGVVSRHIARLTDPAQILSCEPNPAAAAVARALLARSGFDVAVRETMVVSAADADAGAALEIDAGNFLGSRIVPGAGAAGAVRTSRVRLSELLDEWRPDTLVIDVEGAECGLFERADLSGVRTIILELHPEVIGADGCLAVLQKLHGAGFGLVPEAISGQVVGMTCAVARRGEARHTLLQAAMAALQGARFAQAGRQVQAIRNLTAAVEALPGNAFVALQLAARMAPGNPHRARLIEPLTRRPEVARRARHMWAQDLSAQGEEAAAVELLLADPYGGHGYELALASRALVRLGDAARACETAEAAVAAIPCVGVAHQAFGVAHLAAGAPEPALAALTRARALDPTLAGLERHEQQAQAALRVG